MKIKSKPVKRVIGGKTYDTSTASLVARYSDDERNDELYQQIAVDAGIYVTKGGAYFIVRHETVTDIDAKNNDRSYEPDERTQMDALSRAALDRLIGGGDYQIEIVDESLLPPPPEAEAEEEEEAATSPLYLRLPPSLKARVEAAARSASRSVNIWVRQAIEAELEVTERQRKPQLKSVE